MSNIAAARMIAFLRRFVNEAKKDFSLRSK
jgi:hypothetical protein